MPAPFWFVEFFKVVGFVLHMIPMGIWFAGIPIALLCALANTPNSRRYAERMFGQFPIMLALGINFGIVPLLFLQTTYYKPFYTATILMAWHWLAIIPILLVGYYSVYLAAFSAGVPAKCHIDHLAGTPAPRNWRLIGFGALATLCLTLIGILITNGLTLMVRSDLWPGIMEKTNYFGATTGLANNMSDPAVWLRLATMFCIGLSTTAVWGIIDAFFFLPKSEDEESREKYCRWTLLVLPGIGIMVPIVVMTIVSYIITGVPVEQMKVAYTRLGILNLTAMIFAPGLMAFARLFKKQAYKFVLAGAAVHVLFLAGFGILRQIGQNAGVKPVVDVANLPTAVQWTPLLAFLVVFVLGLLCIAWMVRQLVLCEQPNNSRNGGGTPP